jgi:hypothetical protein
LLLRANLATPSNRSRACKKNGVLVVSRFSGTGEALIVA